MLTKDQQKNLEDEKKYIFDKIFVEARKRFSGFIYRTFEHGDQAERFLRRSKSDFKQNLSDIILENKNNFLYWIGFIKCISDLIEEYDRTLYCIQLKQKKEIEGQPNLIKSGGIDKFLNILEIKHSTIKIQGKADLRIIMSKEKNAIICHENYFSTKVLNFIYSSIQFGSEDAFFPIATHDDLLSQDRIKAEEHEYVRNQTFWVDLDECSKSFGIETYIIHSNSKYLDTSNTIKRVASKWEKKYTIKYIQEILPQAQEMGKLLKEFWNTGINISVCDI